MDVLVTTDPGIEDITAEEAAERTRVQTVRIEPFGFPGHLLISIARADLARLLSIRSAHHIIELISAERLAEPTLDAIKARITHTQILPLESAERFRVTAQRTGTHDFTSMDIAREVGAALYERYRVRVDLEGYDVNVRVQLIDTMLVIGIQHTRESLARRYDRAYIQRATLKGTLAYAMLRLARAADARTILDPFCGSGTILLEAAQAYPHLTLYGGDRDVRAVAGARENIARANLSRKITVREADARDLDEAYANVRADAIVSNLPYGLRIARKADHQRLYERFLSGADMVLGDDGRIVVLALKQALLERTVSRSALWRVSHKRRVETGGVYPGLFVIERKKSL